MVWRLLALVILVGCCVPTLAMAETSSGDVAGPSAGHGLSEPKELLALDVGEWLSGLRRGGREEGDAESAFTQVSNLSSSAASVTWISTTTGRGQVEYGTTPQLGSTVEESASTQAHFLWLTGLPADRVIYYRIRSAASTSDVREFRTSRVAAGTPRTVFGIVPPGAAVTSSARGKPVVVQLRLVSGRERSMPLAVRVATRGTWILNLGNLKSENGDPFPHSGDMRAEIHVDGVDEFGEPMRLLSYQVNLADAPDGDLSPRPDPMAEKLEHSSATSSPWQMSAGQEAALQRMASSSEVKERNPERDFLESLLAGGVSARRESRRGHGKPHVVPGWRGGSTMASPSIPPQPSLPPSRLQLSGDRVLREIVRLREERSDAVSFFPDVERHFPNLRGRLRSGVVPISLFQGLNIIALPVDPTTTVTSYTFLEQVPEATDVTAWDGLLQQFGPSAIRIGDEITGDEFPFDLGYGYFSHVQSPAQAAFTGEPVLFPPYNSVPAGLDLVSLIGGPGSVTSHSIFEELFKNGSEICRLDGESQRYECAIQVSPGVIIGDMFPIEAGTGYFIRNEDPSSFPEDAVDPSMTIVSPAPDTEVHSLQPFVEIIFGDHQLGIDLETFGCEINGIAKASFFEVDEFGAEWQLMGAEELVEGSNTIEAWISDTSGNQRSILSSFDVVTLPPAADEHFVNGYVYHGDTWAPMPGVAVTIETLPGVIFTDVEGHYVFPTPGLGDYRLDFDREHFTYAQSQLSVAEGDGDVFVDDVYLSPKDSVETRITPMGGVAVNSDGSVFTSFPDLVASEDIDVSAFNLDDPEDIPSSLPEESIFTYCVKFWPDAAEFNGEAFVDQTNSRAFSGGMPIPVGHYDPISRTWMDEGTALVQPDSSWFDFSLTHFMSFVDCNIGFIAPPRTGPPAGDPDFESGPRDPDEACDSHGSPALGRVKQKSGGMVVEHQTPAVMSVGEPKALTLSYASHTIVPNVVFESGTIPSQGQASIVYTGAQLEIAGQRFTSVIGNSTQATRQRIRFDSRDQLGNRLPTGAFHFETVLTNYTSVQYAEANCFGCPPSDSTNIWTDFPAGLRTRMTGNFELDDRSTSEFGSGWSLVGLQRLEFRSDRDIAVLEGGGESSSFRWEAGGPIPDLAWCEWYPDRVSVTYGDGNGGFEDDYWASSFDFPHHLVALDLDLDGHTDLAASTWSYGTVRLYFGSGYRHIVHRGTFYGQFSGSYAIAAGNIDRDPGPDIVVGRSGCVEIFPNDGSGELGANTETYIIDVDMTPSSIVVNDFDRDGLQDLACVGGAYPNPNRLAVLRGDGWGNFSLETEQEVPGAEALASADLNADGVLDLVVTVYAPEGFVVVLLGNQESGFETPQQIPVTSHAEEVVIDDFDLDGIPDIAVQGRDSAITVLLGNGDGSFHGRRDFETGGDGAYQIVSADFTGDGYSDLAIVRWDSDEPASSSVFEVLVNDGAGRFEIQSQYSVRHAEELVAADLDGDRYAEGFVSEPGDFSHLAVLPDSSGYVRIYPDSSQVLFDLDGFQISAFDRNGNETSYQYDDEDRLSAITYPGDLVATLEYGPDGKIEAITDAASRITEFEHDSEGRLVSITDPDGSQWQYDYDGDHLLWETIDPRGNRTNYEYDENGYVARIAGPGQDEPANSFLASDSYNTLNEAMDQGYGTPDNPAPVVLPNDVRSVFVNTRGDSTQTLTNQWGRPGVQTDALGRTTRFEHDPNGLLTKVTRPDGTTAILTRTGTGQVASRMESSNGATTRYDYDPAFDQVVQTISATDDTTRFDLDDRGNVVLRTDPLGNLTQYFYDSRGLRLKEINALGDSTLYSYGSTGNLDSLRNERGHVTAFEYDLAGNRTAVTDPLQNRTEYEYDANGRLIREIDPLDREVQYIYDSDDGGPCCGGDGRSDLLVATVNAVGDTTHFEYDELGRLIATTDVEGYVSGNRYDSENNLTRVTNPVGHWVSSEYDAKGNVIAQSDTLGQTYSFEYDSRNRRILRTSPGGGEIRYGYDGAGNLTSIANADADSTFFTYDLANRRITKVDPLGRLVSCRYDPRGQMDRMISAAGDTTLYEYDPLGRLIAERFPDGNRTYEYDATGNVLVIEETDSRLEYTYDAANRLLSETTGDVENPENVQPVGTIEYVYDVAGQLETLTDPQLQETAYEYDLNGNVQNITALGEQLFTFDRDALGRLTQLTRPNGTSSEYRFLGSSLIAAVGHWNGSTLIDSLSYGYDELGSLESTLQAGFLTTYEYDDRDQLSAAMQEHPDLPDEWYQYDLSGNRIASHLSSGYSYDAADQIESNDQFTFGFDADGNLAIREDPISFDRWEYEYDYEHRIESVRFFAAGVSPPSIESFYAYDGIGRRILRVVGSDTTAYVYDGEDILVEYQLDGSVAARYVNGPGIDQPLQVTRGETSYDFLPDRLGSIVAIADEAGLVVGPLLYDSFGQPMGTNSADSVATFAFTGREWDGEEKLYNYRARAYDPSLGRFLSRDPIGVGADELNLYEYVDNSPGAGVDPFGADWVNGLANGSAAFGDWITGWLPGGGTKGIRRMLNDRYWGGHDIVDYCSGSYQAGEWLGKAWVEAAGTAIGLRAFRGIKAFRRGPEWATREKNFRIAPFGNAGAPSQVNPLGRNLPHYHRRGRALPSGETTPGQGIGRHRPWERSPHDSSWLDRF